MKVETINGAREVIIELHRKVAAVGSQKKAAKELGISTSYLCDLLAGRRELTVGLAKALGFRIEARFVWCGFRSTWL